MNNPADATPVQRLARQVGSQTVPSLLLLYVALYSVTHGLGAVVRGLDVGRLMGVAVLALLAGWWLARLAVRPWWLATLCAVVLGVAITLVVVGQLGDELATVGQAALAMAFWPWRAAGWPDMAPLLNPLNTLLIGIETLFVRLLVWLVSVAQGKTAYDPVAVALVWNAAVWAVAVWAGWAVRRGRRPLLAVVPALALLSVVAFYTGGGINMLTLLLAATLLLLGFIAFNEREQYWQAHRIDYFDEARRDSILAVIPLVLALMLAAAAAPSISWKDLVELANRYTRKASADRDPVLPQSLGLQTLPTRADVFDLVRSPGLPRGHLIGSGPELSHDIVMLISTGDLPPNPQPAALKENPPPRYYWRSTTYDRYTGRGWLASGTLTPVDYRAGVNVQPIEAVAYRAVEQQVTAVKDLGTLLYATGTLLTADHDYRVAWRSPEDPFGATLEAPTYRAVSWLPVFTESSLRQAGSDYPDWVKTRYLALPDEVPPRVRQLAYDLTVTAPTPYDRARAIESYLRLFRYTLDLPAPPPDRDIADYFLFGLKRGYCDYYATSMVVLARAAGLPARLVVGYASGTYDAANARYVVTEADAHSWPEIYFPGYGWVQFEPTAGQPAIERPSEAALPAIPDSTAALDAAAAWRAGRWRVAWRWLAGAAGALALGALAAFAIDLWRLVRLAPAAAIDHAYHRLQGHARRLAGTSQPGDTPYEFAAHLCHRLTELSRITGFDVSTDAGEDVRQLVELYVRAFYSPAAPGLAERAQAVTLWRRLRQRLWLAWAVTRVWQFTGLANADPQTGLPRSAKT